MASSTPKNNTADAKTEAIVNTAAAIATQSAAPSPEAIEAWKVQYGQVYEIELEDGEKCWLRQPNRRDLAAAQASGKKNPLKFNESILANCWLAGDDRIKTNDQLFLAASSVLDEILEFKSASVKKL